MKTQIMKLKQMIVLLCNTNIQDKAIKSVIKSKISNIENYINNSNKDDNKIRTNN